MTPTPADALVFFGATGDLAYKKIFPALYGMARHRHLDVPVVAVAKSGWTLARPAAAWDAGAGGAGLTAAIRAVSNHPCRTDYRERVSGGGGLPDNPWAPGGASPRISRGPVPSPVPCRIGINWCQLKGCHGGAQIFASYRAGPKGMLSGWVVTGGTVRYSRGGGAGAWRITAGILATFAAQELDTCQSRCGAGKVSGTGRR